jgi:HEAT repeat protein
MLTKPRSTSEPRSSSPVLGGDELHPKVAAILAMGTLPPARLRVRDQRTLDAATQTFISLFELGRADPSAIQDCVRVLTPYLKSRQEHLRLSSIAIGTLLEASYRVRNGLAFSTVHRPQELDPLARRAASLLMPLAGDAVYWIRANALHALGGLGVPTRAVIRTLLRGLRDPVPEVRRSAASALGRLADECSSSEVKTVAARAVKPLALSVGNCADDQQARINAASALARFGRQAGAAVGVIRKVVADRSSGPVLRRIAKDALARIQEGAPEGVNSRRR